MSLGFLFDGFRDFAEKDALVWRDRAFSYADLSASVERWRGFLAEKGLPRGSVTALEADFSPSAAALLLALVESGAIVVPLTESVRPKKSEFLETAEVEAVIEIDAEDRASFSLTGRKARHPLIMTLKDQGHPGVVLFSSGSTGASKAAIHDFLPLLDKFRVRRMAKRTISFLLFDHIGGLNTLLYTLSNGGCLVTVSDRSPEAVAAAIERFRVEVLPTSPTFLNLLLLSEAGLRHDLSSLTLVTYGTEVMPETTLSRIRELLPAVRLQQTYGLSEIGIMRSKSRSSDSLWVKIGGEGFETRVVNGLLEIKARSAMLGYLNAESPFTEDGWLKTGDAVLVDGEYMRILGRKTDIINVGGMKVYAADVEGQLQAMEGVEDAAVTGIPNAITGQMVSARVKLSTAETLPEFRKRMRAFLKDRVPAHHIPQKVELIDKNLHSGRFKKMRRVVNEEE